MSNMSRRQKLWLEIVGIIVSLVLGSVAVVGVSDDDDDQYEDDRETSQVEYDDEGEDD